MKTQIVLTLIVTAFLLTACQREQTVLDRVPPTEQELIYNPDLFLSNFSSMNTTVLGVRVGMTEREVLEKLGTPDHMDEFNFGAIRNLQYGRALGLNSTGVVYHLEYGFVTRIAVGPAMNELLGRTTAVNKTKADIYSIYGTPDRQYDIRQGRFFVYNKQGFEVYLNHTHEFQYAFVYPNRKLDSTAVLNKTKNQFEIINVETPRLISDTTTLCDQGKTFGYSIARKECKEFANSCEIPSHWTEVESCEGVNNATTVGEEQ